MSDDEPEVTVFPPTIKAAGDPRGQQATWTLMPVDTSDGRCSQCATKHEPEEPHNRQAIYYQYAFRAEHGRWPTWNDAIAHCSAELRQAWTDALVERGIEMDR